MQKSQSIADVDSVDPHRSALSGDYGGIQGGGQAGCQGFVIDAVTDLCVDIVHCLGQSDCSTGAFDASRGELLARTLNRTGADEVALLAISAIVHPCRIVLEGVPNGGEGGA